MMHLNGYTSPRLDATLSDLEVGLDLLRAEVAKLRRPPVRSWGLDPAMPAGALAGKLRECMGQRRFRVLLTKMAGLDREARLEARTGRRANGNG